MPTIKAKAKATAATKEAAVETVKVSAAVKAAVSAIFTAESAVTAALQQREQKWLNCGQTLAKEFADKEDARTVLKLAFVQAGHGTLVEKDGKQVPTLEIKEASYVSKILTLGYPENKEIFQAAVEAGFDTGRLVSVGRGALAPKKGKDAKDPANWIPVGGDNRGGNRTQTTPAQTLEKNLLLAINAAVTAKLKKMQIATILRAALATAFGGEDAATEILALAKD